MLVLCGMTILWLLTFINSPQHNSSNQNITQSFLIFTIMSLIGTTVAPWQLYFQHCCILDKRLTLQDLKHEKIETFIGSVFTTIVAGCMMYFGFLANKLEYKNIPDLVVKFNFLPVIIIMLILISSVIGTASVSLTSAWINSEYVGWHRSLNKKFSEAKSFYIQYFGAIILAGCVTLIPNLPLNFVIIGVQVLACVFLPFQMIINLILLNDNRIMKGIKNSKSRNIILVLILLMIVVLSFFLFKQAVFK